ncbi:hypothetical protein DFJ73DRAFT_960614 [Zopfochytrium polystomum]|nr:hypothetical protein DFJ73DRAFT_960614 [Zopfochytrium polystomum]
MGGSGGGGGGGGGRRASSFLPSAPAHAIHSPTLHSAAGKDWQLANINGVLGHGSLYFSPSEELSRLYLLQTQRQQQEQLLLLTASNRNGGPAITQKGPEKSLHSPPVRPRSPTFKCPQTPSGRSDLPNAPPEMKQTNCVGLTDTVEGVGPTTEPVAAEQASKPGAETGAVESDLAVVAPAAEDEVSVCESSTPQQWQQEGAGDGDANPSADRKGLSIPANPFCSPSASLAYSPVSSSAAIPTDRIPGIPAAVAAPSSTPPATQTFCPGSPDLLPAQDAVPPAHPGQQSGQLSRASPAVDFEKSAGEIPTDEKPPFSYVQLITMAIRSAPEQKMVLNDIYLWVAERYPYFKMEEKAWKNSVRHNLSISKIFVRELREDADKRSGAYWKIDPSVTSEPLKPRGQRSAGLQSSISHCQRTKFSWTNGQCSADWLSRRKRCCRLRSTQFAGRYDSFKFYKDGHSCARRISFG